MPHASVAGFGRRYLRTGARPDRHGTLHERIESLVHDTHRTTSYTALDFVLGDLGRALIFFGHFKILSAQRFDQTVMNTVECAIAHDDDLVPALTVLQQIVDNALGIGFYLN